MSDSLVKAPYQQAPQCAKCGNSTVKYGKYDESIPWFLQITCVTCEYVWLQETKDKKVKG